MSERRLAFFDVAGTLVAGNPWRGFLKYPRVNKWRLYRNYPAILAPWWAKKLGMISDTRFRQIWIRQMANLLRGMTRTDVDEMFRWIAQDFMRDDYREDVVSRLKLHISRGDYVVLVSGMFTPLTQQFANYLGADGAVGTSLEFDERDVCTGKILGEGCAGDLKPKMLKAYLSAQGIALDDAIIHAYADSYSDVPLLSLAKYSVATYPDEGLANIVRQQQWEMIGEQV